VALQKLRTDAGYLWISAAGESAHAFMAMRVWSRTGFSEEVALQLIAPGFYRFTPFDAQGDALVFLTDTRNATHFGCVQSGKTMDATPRYVRDYLAAEMNVPVQCSDQE
jgi:hypothetical protein